jgi:ligand-binding sensor domain-containing protein/signal transduction histidine kinase
VELNVSGPRPAGKGNSEGHIRLYSREVLLKNSDMPKHYWRLAIALLLPSTLTFGLESAPGSLPESELPFIVEPMPAKLLPQSSVIALTQGRDGFLWLGTLNGLVRFDGIQSKVFTEANTPGLTSSEIVYLAEDSRSNLWVGTKTAGIALVTPEGNVRRIEMAPGVHAGKLRSISEDLHGRIWLNLENGEVWRFQTNGLEMFGRAMAAVADRSGLVWLGGETNLFGISSPPDASSSVVRFDLPFGKLDFVLADRTLGIWKFADGRVEKWVDGRRELDLGEYPWGNSRISSACQDDKGNLIVGTMGSGVFWFNPNSKTIQISTRQGLSSDVVLSLALDREGGLWVGTDGGGLNRVKRKLFALQPGTAGLTIQSVSSDQQGGIWYANFGYKVYHWNGGVLKSYGTNEGGVDLSMTVLAENSNVWVGTVLLGLFRKEGEAFHQALGVRTDGVPLPQNPQISALFGDRDKHLWVGSQSGLLRREGDEWKLFTTANGLPADDVRALADDAEGRVWIGTDGGGLACLQGNRMSGFRKSELTLPSDSVSALCVDSAGVLWVGTRAGLARLHEGKWTRYTTQADLAGISVGYLLDDESGFLWLGSNGGLLRVSKKSLNDIAAGEAVPIQVRLYGPEDGLPTLECSQGAQPAACRTEDGRLWFATVRGLASVNPADLKPNLHPPPVVIESVLVDGALQGTNRLRSAAINGVTLPAGRQLLEIRYTSLNLSGAERTRFRYRLEGHETVWTDAGSSRVARFNKLPPGRYRFHVAAANEDGIWNEAGAELGVVVLPPFWRTWWFIATNALALLALLVAIIRYMSTQKLQRQLAVLRQHEALEKERARIARDLHDQLGANLTQISILGEMAAADKHLSEEIEEHAQQISQTARETTRALDEIVWALNPSNDTLEGLITYACKYAQDFFGIAGLRYRLDVPTHLPGIPIAPEVRHNVFLAFKEAVNNVVKHAHASEARIRLELQAGRFVVEIQDNGRGVSSGDEKKGRNGLRNMRQRMEDVAGSFSVSPASGKGTTVRLTVPIATA